MIANFFGKTLVWAITKNLKNCTHKFIKMSCKTKHSASKQPLSSYLSSTSQEMQFLTNF